MKKSLLPLMLGGLGIGITEFVMMGLLPDLVSKLTISIPVAGHLIAVYALGVVVGAPVLILATRKFQPKKLLLFLMLLFTLFNATSAFAPTYYFLLLTRFLSGLPHGAFFGVGSVVASRIAEKGKESQAISMMFSGMTIANLVGVPLGTFIGHHYSWRYTFILIAIIGLITILGIAAWLPKLKAMEHKNIKEELLFFSHGDSWLIILLIAIGTGGLFSWISYIAPLLTSITHFDLNAIPYIMALAGLGMVFGNIIGGKLADRYSPAKTIMTLMVTITIFLIVIHFTASLQILSLIMTFAMGAAAFALVAPIQMMMISFSRGSEMLASSVSQSCFNISNALGAFLGGLPLVFGFSYAAPEVVGAMMTSLGAIIVWLLMVKRKKQKSYSQG
ncbi:MAG: MFS transporter [Chthoniobacterales bacterium]